MSSFDAIIIGVGAMGASACYHLARRGVRVLGLEQFDIPHNLGSSHGLSRMIRMAYYEHPDYVPLLRRAYELWRELEQISGRKLLHITGGLYMGPADCELVAQSALAARQHGLEHEMLSRDQIAARFRQFVLPDHFVGLHEPTAGFLLPESAITAYARTAMQIGALIHGRERVRDWSSDGAGVTVRTDLAEYRAQRLILTAGAWSGKLVEDLRDKLTVTRQVLAWFWPARLEAFELGRFPVWGIDRAQGGLYYGFPVGPDDVGLKVAVHAPGQPTDPDRLVRDPRPGDLDEIQAVLRKHLPSGFGSVLSQRVCMYTNSPDHHFIIDKHPRYDGRVIVACGFSGHGFKFASVVGQILADLATHEKTDLPATFLGFSRLGQLR